MYGLKKKISRVINNIHTMKSILVVLILLLTFTSAHSDELLNHIKKANLIDVLNPKKNETIYFQPVYVNIKFNGDVDIDSFRAWLNTNDVTQRFIVNSTGAYANLSEQDGLRVSSRKNRNNSSEEANDISNRAKNSISNNIVFTINDGTANHKFKAKQKFYFDNSALKAEGFISTDGGQITLPGYATIIFPSGAFPNEQHIELSATRSPETAHDFEETAFMFDAGQRIQYELRLNSGVIKPKTDFQAIISVPADFLSTVPADSEIQVFAQILQNSGEEVLDNFELFDSVYSSSDNTVTVTLPPESFTNNRRVDETYEVIIILATTPTKPITSMVSPLSHNNKTTPAEQLLPLLPDALPVGPPAATTSTTSCQGASLGSPLNNPEVTSAYKEKTHYGADYRAVDGTSVRSMSDGVVERIGFDERPLPKPDPRSGKMVKGWGRFVVVKHSDGSRSLYAHLQRDGVQKQVGDTVTQGDLIALSDNTGGSSGPHLHVEYAPNGKIYDKKSKVDPDPCINKNVIGSITVRDNGPLADDAFSIAINGLVVCRTAIGASNTCAVGNLRSGTATLTLVTIIAPDNVGTYEISLADELTFSDGSAIRSGTSHQGESVSFSILIPVKE